MHTFSLEKVKLVFPKVTALNQCFASLHYITVYGGLLEDEQEATGTERWSGTDRTGRHKVKAVSHNWSHVSLSYQTSEEQRHSLPTPVIRGHLELKSKGRCRSHDRKESPLKVPPGVWRRELIHITRFIMRFVPQVECQLVPQTHFFLKYEKQTSVQC